MSTTTDKVADFTLQDLWKEGIQALVSEEPSPGATYEVGPGLIGTLPWLTLEERQKGSEIRSQLGHIFRKNATPEEFENLRRLSRGKSAFEIYADGAHQGRWWGEGEEEALERFAEDEGFEDLADAQKKLEGLEATLAEEVKTPIREKKDNAEGDQTVSEVNCELAAYVLDFDEDVRPSDIVPEMAAVVSRHFTKFGARLNGQKAS